MFDPEAFGAAMGEMIREAVKPLHAEIALLKAQLAQRPVDGKNGEDGKDCDMQAVKQMIDEAVKAIPPAAAGRDGLNGKNGEDGKDGASITVADVMPILSDAIKKMNEEARASVEMAVKAIPTPINGANGRDGADGAKGEPGEKGADGLGLAGAMIDRDGSLLVTLTNGEVKSLGPVVGKNGVDGTNGQDGIGFDSFDIEYLPDTHEVSVKATALGRTKEARYPAGGIRPAGYWREGTKAKAGEAWVHDGSTWFATKDTNAKPSTSAEGWIIAARKGRDGETTIKTIGPVEPVKLK